MTRLLLALMLCCALLATGIAAYAQPQGSPAPFEQAIRALPADKAQAFHQSLKKAQEANKALAGEIRKLREEMRGIMNAPEFDRDMYLAKAKHIQDVRASMQANLSAAFADAAAKLTQEERVQMSDTMHKEPRKNAAETAGTNEQ